MPLVPTVAPGQIISSSAWGNIVGPQTVQRFATAGQRASQLTAPALGQLTQLDTRPQGIEYWNGSAWVNLLAVTRFYANVTQVPVSSGGAADVDLGGFTAPFAGTLMVSGCALFVLAAGTAGTQVQCIIEPSPVSVPGAVENLSATSMLTVGQISLATIPWFARFNVAAGQVCNIKARVSATGNATVHRFWGDMALHPVLL